MKIYIIDAVNFLFRAYYAIGSMTNGLGQSTNALFGFIRSIQKLLREVQAEYAVCVFDGPDNKESRRALYAEYKMHRKAAPEDLFAQFEWAYTYCQLAGIPILSEPGVEADDVIGSIAKWAEKEGAEVFICSSDKDLCQLVNERVFMLHAHKENLLVDAKKVEELFGVRPDQIVDLLAIMGDTSDNIPGLEGFGPKTAATLLQQLGTLDNILKHPEQVKGEKKQEILRTQKEIALMSRELAMLDTAIAVPHEALFYQRKKPDQQKLAEFFHAMQFHSLLRELGPQEEAKRNYHLVESELEQVLLRLSEQPEVCIAVHAAGVALSYQPGEAWFVPHSDKLAHFFATAPCAFYGHDTKRILHTLKGLKNISFDTLIASYLLAPQIRQHDLASLALEHLKKVKISPKADDLNTLCEEADFTVQLKALFEKELEKTGLMRLYREIELPLIPILAKMEEAGVYLDVEPMRELARKLSIELEQCQKTIFDEVGETFNLNSPKQLSHILFDKLGLEPPRKTKASTNAAVLEELAPTCPPIQHILQYRMLEKLRSTYVEALPKAIHPDTGRIHCTFNQSGTATGRLSCQDPNLQNIPIRSGPGLAIRACFKPQKPGWLFLGADYSQIELRLLAHFSQDPELLTAFRGGHDVHVHTASLIFDVKEGEITPEMRSQAKTVNFGIVYGQGPFGLSQQLGISVQEASAFIKKYFERYSLIHSYLDECKAEARKSGYATTLRGRRRPIPDLASPNPAIRAAAERLATNTPLQGTAADLIKMAMIEINQSIQQQGLNGKLILQIHDELIFEVPETEISSFQAIVKEKMEQVSQLSVPIEVHIAVGKNWAEC